MTIDYSGENSISQFFGNTTSWIYSLFAFSLGWESVLAMKLFMLLLFFISIVSTSIILPKDDNFRFLLSILISMNLISIYLASSLHPASLSIYFLIPLTYTLRNWKRIIYLPYRFRVFFILFTVFQIFVLLTSRVDGFLYFFYCVLALAVNLKASNFTKYLRSKTIMVASFFILSTFILLSISALSDRVESLRGTEDSGRFWRNLRFSFSQRYELLGSIFGADVNREGSSFYGNYALSFPKLIVASLVAVSFLYLCISFFSATYIRKLILILFFFAVFIPSSLYKTFSGLEWNVQLQHILPYLIAFNLAVLVGLPANKVRRGFLISSCTVLSIANIAGFIQVYEYYQPANLGALPFFQGYSKDNVLLFYLVLLIIGFGYLTVSASVVTAWDELIESPHSKKIVKTRTFSKNRTRRPRKKHNWWSRESLNR